MPRKLLSFSLTGPCDSRAAHLRPNWEGESEKEGGGDHAI